jgi:RNA polymerase sigma factor (sigma-70 family)
MQPAPRDALPTETLVLEAVSGDSRAREALYTRFLPVLQQWARGRIPVRARDLLDTDDLVQEAAIGSLRNLQGLERHGGNGFLGYLKASVSNRIRDEIRRVGRHPGVTDMDLDLPDERPDALHQLMTAQDLERYENALGRLDAAGRELVIARLEFQMSYDEIAIHSGKSSPDAARMATRRAVRRLAELLADEVSPRPPG